MSEHKEPPLHEAILNDLRSLVAFHQAERLAFGTPRAVSICLQRAAAHGAMLAVAESAVFTNLRLLENGFLPPAEIPIIKAGLEVMCAESSWFREILDLFSGLKAKLGKEVHPA